MNTGRHLFYVEAQHPTGGEIVAFVVSADSDSVLKAQELAQAALLDEHLPEGAAFTHVKYLGECAQDVLVEIGELVQ